MFQLMISRASKTKKSKMSFMSTSLCFLPSSYFTELSEEDESQGKFLERNLKGVIGILILQCCIKKIHTFVLKRSVLEVTNLFAVIWRSSFYVLTMPSYINVQSLEGEKS